MDTDDNESSVRSQNTESGNSSSESKNKAVQNLDAKMGELQMTDDSAKQSTSDNVAQPSAVREFQTNRNSSAEIDCVDHSTRFVMKEFPNQSLVEVKLRFFIHYDSFKFKPERDSILLVLKDPKLGNGSAVHSPFVVRQDCVKPFEPENENINESFGKISQICASFDLPKQLLLNGVAYKYSVKSNLNEPTWQDELIKIRLMDCNQQDQQIMVFDGLIRGPDQPVSSGTRSAHNPETQFRFVASSMLLELRDKKVPPETVVNQIEAMLERTRTLMDPHDYKIKELPPKMLKLILEKIADTPDAYGFSTAEDKSWEQWLANISLFILGANRRLFPFIKHGASFQLKQASAKALLTSILPPVEVLKQFRDAIDVIVFNGSDFYPELLFLVPAIHLLAWNVSPLTEDVVFATYGWKHDNSEPVWWGTCYKLRQFDDNLRKVKIDFKWLDLLIEKYGAVDPLLCRFCATVVREDNLPQLFELKHMPGEVKLATAVYFVRTSPSGLQRFHAQLMNLLEASPVSELAPASLSICQFVGLDLAHAVQQKTLYSHGRSEMTLMLQFRSVDFALRCLLETKRRKQIDASLVDFFSNEQEAQATYRFKELADRLVTHYRLEKTVQSLLATIQQMAWKKLRSLVDPKSSYSKRVCEVISSMIVTMHTKFQKAPDATLRNVQVFLGDLLNEENQAYLVSEFQCFQCDESPQLWDDYLRKLLFARKISSYSNAAAAIIHVLEAFQMTDELAMLRKVLQMGERSMDTPLQSIQTADLDQFDYLDEFSKEEYFVPMMSAIHRSHEFCVWVRGNVQKQDLKTFFDLAMIYLGDSDVKDLQSKLMLIAGQSYENRELLERFTELAPLFCTADATDKVGRVLLHLLGYLSPNCSVEDINKTVDDVVVQRAQSSRKQAQSDDTHSIITEHLRDEGFSEDIIKQTARILFRNTDLDDLPTVEELQEQATDLAYKVERNTVTQADKQPRKEWKTADQELIAAE
uniref:BTB domain-containing protein n=1 Tax=Macrostomum lignano TaxID=282301 RepID=A0A1I8GQR6_9PLAT